MGVAQIYDQGQTFASSVLDIEESQLLKAISAAVTTVASISLATNYPTLPSVMHSMVNSYKKILSVAVETEYEWDEVKELKDRITNPDKYASAAPSPDAGQSAAPEASKEAEKEPEPAEESEDDEMMGDLFG